LQKIKTTIFTCPVCGMPLRLGKMRLNGNRTGYCINSKCIILREEKGSEPGIGWGSTIELI